MSQTITISGKPFEVEPRYVEGAVLTANEASALNQTYFENLRNNFAGKAKDGGTQDEFSTYATAYQFGVRTGGGGGSRDPVETEAMSMARDAIKAGIKKAGKNVSDFSAASITSAAGKLLDKDPKYRELAAKRVAELQSSASDEIDADLLSGLEAAAPAEPDTGDSATDAVDSGATSGKKGKAAAAV